MYKIIVAGLFSIVLALGVTAGNADTRPAPSERLVIVGVDGMTFNVIDPLLAQGKLPTFAKLLHQGSKLTLMSEKPMRSPALWTTVATGHNRSVHRIFDFVTGSWFWPEEERKQKQRLVTSDMRQAPAIWNMTSKVQKKNLVVGWLNTWPAEKVDGVMVAPYVALGERKQTSIKGKIYEDAKQQTYPEKLFPKLKNLIRSAGSITDAELARIVVVPPKDSALYEEVPSLERYLYTARWSMASTLSNTAIIEDQLRKNPDTNLVMTYFDGSDTLAHRFWLMRQSEEQIRTRLRNQGFNPDIAAELKNRFGGIIDNYYELVDEMLARIMVAAGPNATIMVISDHGWEDLNLDKVIHKSVPFDGRHSLKGAMIASGPHIKAGTFSDRTLYDITPTALYLMGVSVPGDLPGDIALDIISEPFKRHFPPMMLAKGAKRLVTPTSNQPQTDTHFHETEIERLKSLGYVQ
jgi:predicted AlkP superfamily phosphohydrolase/phosphomutase